MFLYSSAVGGGGMCIPTFVDFFLFHFFFSLSLSFSFSFLSVSQVAGPYGIFFFSFSVRLSASKLPRSPINSNFFFHQVFFLWSTAQFVTLPPLASTHVNFLLTMSLLTPAGDQLVVRGGNAHFFTYTRIR